MVELEKQGLKPDRVTYTQFILELAKRGIYSLSPALFSSPLP
jgi:hypothetical protein